MYCQSERRLLFHLPPPVHREKAGAGGGVGGGDVKVTLQRLAPTSLWRARSVRPSPLSACPCPGRERRARATGTRPTGFQPRLATFPSASPGEAGDCALGPRACGLLVAPVKPGSSGTGGGKRGRRCRVSLLHGVLHPRPAAGGSRRLGWHPLGVVNAEEPWAAGTPREREGTFPVSRRPRAP